MIILCTAWAEDYWESPKEAPYPKRSYKEFPEWDSLANTCPLPGLGIYIKQKDKDYTNRNFVFLKIKGMRFDKENERPYFSFEPIAVSKTPSINFTQQFPPVGNRLFSAVEGTKVLEVLQTIGEEPPDEWKGLIKFEEKLARSWRDYVGKYFLELIDTDLSNNEFEDRCSELLKALGFKVSQLGHIVIGEYPDGEAFLDEDVIIYDCKNTEDFIPATEDKRKLDDYRDNAKLVHKNKDVYGVFIAKNFGEKQTGDFLFFPVSVLVYLLYKKIALGHNFNLSPFRKILAKRLTLDQNTIDNEWRM